MLIYLNRPDMSQRQILIRLCTALLAPLIVMLGLLGLYNYLRFDSFLEFGLQYQMSGTNIHLLYKEGVVTSIHRVPLRL